jgi:hypothetical protein
MWWDPFRTGAETWLSETDLRGDALKSLRSVDNSLSVYILNDEDPDSLERVLAAFAAQRETLANLDFALIDADKLQKDGFSLEVLEGKTPDSVVNTWHRDLVRLTGAHILRLASHLQFEAAFCRRRRVQVRQVINKGINAGWIDTAKMNKDLLNEVR